MDRFRQPGSSFAATPENESLPGLDAPASPAELAELQGVESLFRGCLPQGYVPVSSPDETTEEADETDEDADKTDWEDIWDPASELLSIAPSNFIGPLPDSPEIMARLTGFMRRFLACSDDQLTVLALWVLHTWCYRAFHVSPGLNIYSAEKSTGKTICLRLLHILCSESWYAAAPAPADVIQKTLIKPAAILLDDRHLTFSSSGRQQVINFLVCGLVDEERYFASHCRRVVKGCNVFSPRAFAGRGSLPSALADRSIPVCLRPAAFSQAPVGPAEFRQPGLKFHRQGLQRENRNSTQKI